MSKDFEKIVDDIKQEASVARSYLGIPIMETSSSIDAQMIALKKAFDKKDWAKAQYHQNQILINQNAFISEKLISIEKLLKK